MSLPVALRVALPRDCAPSFKLPIVTLACHGWQGRILAGCLMCLTYPAPATPTSRFPPVHHQSGCHAQADQRTYRPSRSPQQLACLPLCGKRACTLKCLSRFTKACQGSLESKGSSTATCNSRASPAALPNGGGKLISTPCNWLWEWIFRLAWRFPRSKIESGQFQPGGNRGLAMLNSLPKNQRFPAKTPPVRFAVVNQR